MTSLHEAGSTRVSVILPTYNQAQYLPQALDSVLNQRWRHFELIVVNDGSTDETLCILDEYQRRYGIRVLHQENQKLPRALNAGFRLARGQYLTWTSSDNIMLPHMLEVFVEALDRHPEVGLVYADWEIIDEHGAVVGAVRTFDFDRFLLMRVNYINACFLYRRACQEKVGLYDPEYIHVEDWEYWFRISCHFPMMRVPQVLYQYRVHSSSLTDTEVRSRASGEAIGYRKLAAVFHAHPWAWYFSKLKWEWWRFKLRQDPQRYLHFGTREQGETG